jgi:hypothetical protein
LEAKIGKPARVKPTVAELNANPSLVAKRLNRKANQANGVRRNEVRAKP